MRYECECGKVWRDWVDYETHKCTPPEIAQTRACLRCGQAFQSWGAGNRLCRLCRDDDDRATAR